MSAIKDGRVPIELDKTRHMLFSLNVIDTIQDKLGDIYNLPEYLNGKDMIKNLKWILTLLINEGAEDEEELTEKQVGRLIHAGNLQNVVTLIYSSFTLGVTGDKDENSDDEEPEEKNAVSEQVK